MAAITALLSFPLDFVCGVRKQLERVWAQVFHQLPINASLSLNEPATFNQSELLAQVSNLSGLVDEAEGLLRRTIGVQAIGELRALMLGFLQAWRNEPWGGYRELMEGVMAEEADLVNQALIHLEALQAGCQARSRARKTRWSIVSTGSRCGPESTTMRGDCYLNNNWNFMCQASRRWWIYTPPLNWTRCMNSSPGASSASVITSAALVMSD